MIEKRDGSRNKARSTSARFRPAKHTPGETMKTFPKGTELRCGRCDRIIGVLKQDSIIHPRLQAQMFDFVDCDFVFGQSLTCPDCEADFSTYHRLVDYECVPMF